MKLIVFLLVTAFVAASEGSRIKRQFFPDYDFSSGPRYPTQQFPNQGQFFPGNQGGFGGGFPGQGGFQGFPNQGGNQGFPNQGGNQGGNQGFPNQGGNQGGNQGFPNQNNNQNNRRPPTNQVTTTQAPIPTAAPTTLSPAMEQCRDACVARTTGQYNPVCGSDGQNYHNQARLDCARECGAGVTRRTAGVCPSMNIQPQ